ncbi:MAG: pyrroline-5-carboxylate reductase [Puniceicoccales bacterium]|jgi:pyrroline-5-carboxylate reductase|nr:pyrroline-5-carboxylate reductase [Puniceicoccales bacterium]
MAVKRKFAFNHFEISQVVSRMVNLRSEIVFLGAGKMAGAIAHGLIDAGRVVPEAMACLGGSGTSAHNLAAATGMRLARDTADLLDGADTLVLACKPQQFANLDPQIGTFTAGKLVLSVLAGFPLERLAAAFPQSRAVVAIMPNTPAQVGAGTTVWTAFNSLAESDIVRVERYFGCLGTVTRIDAALMNAACATSGSGPGFFFEMLAAVEQAAVAAGLPAEIARTLAYGTFIGAAKLLDKSGLPAEVLRDAVTSPNGTTFAGLRVFDNYNLRNIFAETIAAAAARASELGKM